MRRAFFSIRTALFPFAVLFLFPAVGRAAPGGALPTPPPGVSDLKWGEFFVRPVGDGGLTITPRLRGLNGKRVRILGYMVGQEAPTPGVLLLAPIPLTIEEHEGGFSDLPPATVRVLVPHARGAVFPRTHRLLLLTGVLQVGNREEPDGSVSLVRLILDPPLAPVKKPARAGGARAPVQKGFR